MSAPPADAQPKLIVVTGPTACGKTQLVHALARPSDSIINADSRQLYKNLTIGVARPGRHEEKNHSYTLLGAQPLKKPFNAYSFLRHVEKTTKEVFTPKFAPHKASSQASLPALPRIFIVGGTLFYISTLEKGLHSFNVPSHITQEVEHVYRQQGLQAVQKELQQRDPVAYRQLDHRNPRRVLRALALVRAYGQPLHKLYSPPPVIPPSVPHPAQRTHSAQCSQEIPPPSPAKSAINLLPPYKLLKIVLIPPKKQLHATIAHRAKVMFDNNGIIAEVQALLKSGISKEILLKHKAIGYLETIEYLNGFYSKATALEKTIQRTRRLAKQQITWLKKQKNAHFIFLGTYKDFTRPCPPPPQKIAPHYTHPKVSKNSPLYAKRHTSPSLAEVWSLTPDNIEEHNTIHFAADSTHCHHLATNLCQKFNPS